MLIRTVGQLRKLLSQHKNETKVGIEDADEGSFLEITELSMASGQDLLLIGGDYSHRIERASKECIRDTEDDSVAKVHKTLSEVVKARANQDNAATEIAGSEE